MPALHAPLAALALADGNAKLPDHRAPHNLFLIWGLDALQLHRAAAFRTLARQVYADLLIDLRRTRVLLAVP